MSTPTSLIVLLVALESERREASEAAVREPAPEQLLFDTAAREVVGRIGRGLGSLEVTPVDGEDAQATVARTLEALARRDGVSDMIGYRGGMSARSTAGPGEVVLAVAVVARHVVAPRAPIENDVDLTNTIIDLLSHPECKILSVGHRFIPEDRERAFDDDTLAELFPQIREL